MRGCAFKEPRSWALGSGLPCSRGKWAPRLWEGAALGVRGGAGPQGCVGSGEACPLERGVCQGPPSSEKWHREAERRPLWARGFRAGFPTFLP